MEFFEEIGEILEDCEEGFEGEAAAAEEGEVAEEVATEAKEASENVSLLKRGVEALKKLNLPQALRSLTKVVLENVVMAGIFYGVNVVLTKYLGKASDPGQKQAIQKKKIKVKAVTQLLSQIAKASNKLADWSKAKENVSVDVGDDITVPLPDVLSKYTQPIGKDVQLAFNAAKHLKINNGGSGKPTFVVPTTEQVNQIINSAEAILSSLQGIVTFANDKKAKYAALGTLPIQESDVQNLKDDLEKVKKLPYA